MSKKSSRSLGPKGLRVLLSIMLLLSAGAGVAGFIYGQNLLKDYAVEVSHKKIDADASNNTIQALQTLEQKLEEKENKDVLETIGLLRAESEFPEFRIVEEVDKIAKKNGITIESYAYSDGTTNTGTNGAAPSTAAPSTTPGGPSTQTPAAKTTGGKTIDLLITPTSPVDYRNFLQFLADIEQHVPKMKVGGISVSPGSTSSNNTPGRAQQSTNPNQVTVGQLIVQLYI